ncbi:MAG: lactate racemase domain-containing protein, partial [Chloroflexota bacterium]|nr:lactate racemase domain-containing protein [Chloroflexota bacterium]
VEPHMFAGYSGGPKLVAPGVAGLDTVMELHSYSMLDSPKAIWGVTEDNPVHVAIRAIAEQTGVHFTLDVTLNKDHQITGVYAGRWQVSHPAACRDVRRSAMRAVAGPFDVVITTNSGHPLDLNLYQAVKGMSAAAQIVKPGGVIISASECWDGIPEHGEFKAMLHERESIGELMEMIAQPGYRRHDQWEVQILGQILRKARVFLKNGYLSDEQVRRAHLEPTSHIEATLSDALCDAGPDARVCVLPQGPQTIPYLSKDSS